MRSRPHVRRPGTGTGKVFTDVERLCNVHIPRWFETPGMGVEKIAAFYDDPVRAAYHAHSAHKAFQLRSLTIEPGLKWVVARWMRFGVRLAFGMMRQIGLKPSAKPVRRESPITNASAGLGRAA
jgi:hypothetical protein